MPKIFESISKNLALRDRNFYIVSLTDPLNGTDALLDNSFGNITFDELFCYNVTKIETNAFDKVENYLKDFYCDSCSLVNKPPKYDLLQLFNKLFNKIPNLRTSILRLNISELPTSAFNIH